MIALAADDVVDLRRWMTSAAVVVLAHGAIAAATVRWRDVIEPAQPAAAAIVIDFAPILIAPAEIAPGPEQERSEATPEQKVKPQSIEELPADLKPAPNPEFALEPPREIKQESTQHPAAMVPETSPPQPIPVETAAFPAAPIQGNSNPEISKLIQAYGMQVYAILKRSLQYPPTARSRRQEGTAQVFFSIDREGRVLESRIVHSAGAAALDAEALALLKRAQPFPAPPPELAGERITLTVPIAFHLK
jgi:protein TonB